GPRVALHAVAGGGGRSREAEARVGGVARGAALCPCARVRARPCPGRRGRREMARRRRLLGYPHRGGTRGNAVADRLAGPPRLDAPPRSVAASPPHRARRTDAEGGPGPCPDSRVSSRPLDGPHPRTRGARAGPLPRSSHGP